MQLSPLQSRLAASLAASCLLLLVYFSLFSPHFALAADLSPKSPLFVPEDVSAAAALLDRADGVPIIQPDYAPDFAAFDRSILGRRAAAGSSPLENNAPQQADLDPGTTAVFVFSKTSIFSRGEQSARLELRDDETSELDGRSVAEGDGGEAAAAAATAEKRDLTPRQAATKTVFLSANTCGQPQRLADQTRMDPPQLTLYVSTSPQNTSPGPGGSQQTWHIFDEGAIMVNVSATDDIYIGVSAPEVSADMFRGGYNFQLAASVDGWYHSYDETVTSELVWIDSDDSTTLLMSRNLTNSHDKKSQAKVVDQPPYVVFAESETDKSANGVRNSYCGLQNYAQLSTARGGNATTKVTTGITRRGKGNLPKQQFYLSGLNASTTYVGILAANATGGNVVGGGGRVSRAVNFTTKAVGGNCGIILNLTFCNETAYAVPRNPKFSPTELANMYDGYAKDQWDIFTKVLAQIPCEAPSTQKYSLARGCDDCAAAYKTWLCSVTIPRCEDFSVTDSWLQPRNLQQAFPNGTTMDPAVVTSFPNNVAHNSSRNPRIDTDIRPGPYKEVLPCDDVCYNLVQSCPSAMGFACPQPGSPGFSTSYGQRPPPGNNNGSIMCNYPGSGHFSSAAPNAAAPVSWMTLLGLSGFLVLLLL